MGAEAVVEIKAMTPALISAAAVSLLKVFIFEFARFCYPNSRSPIGSYTIRGRELDIEPFVLRRMTLIAQRMIEGNLLNERVGNYSGPLPRGSLQRPSRVACNLSIPEAATEEPSRRLPQAAMV